MKKSLFLLFFFLFLLFQSTTTRILPQLDHYFFLPDLPLILLAYIALFGGPEKGTAVGFFLGFFEDSLSGGIMGLNSLIKTILGFLLGGGAQKFVVTNRLLQCLAVALFTLANDVMSEVLRVMLGSNSLTSFSDIYTKLFFRSLPESIVNGMLAILFFSLFERWQLIKSDRNSI